VILSATGVELLPAGAGAGGQVTAYTAPELLSGQAPDARSDIFSLGAVLYEMFTGRRAFPGETAEEIAASLESCVPEPIGDTAIDRLVLNCLVKDPSGRWHRVQQVHMEFRILLFSAKRAQQLAAPRHREFALQSELRQVESRLHALLDQQYGEAAAGVRQLSGELPLVESQLAARLDRQTAETAAALQHISAELPLMESNLASRLTESHGEAKAALAHLAAELPLLEARVASRLEEAYPALPALESRLTSRIEQQESAIAKVPELASRLTSQLEQHESALAGVHQTISGLPELASRLSSRLDQHGGALAELNSRVDSCIEQHQNAIAKVPELESRLTSQLQQHESALAGVQQAISGLPELESRLTSQLQQHESALAELESRVNSRIEQHESAVAKVPEMESRLNSRSDEHHTALSGLQQAVSGLPELESRLTARIERHERAMAKLPELESRLHRQNAIVESLQQGAAEQRAVFETVSQSANAVQESLDALEGKFATTHENVRRAETAAGQVAEMAGRQASLMSELHALGTTVKSHAATLKSIRASMARNDDFMERIVEALESLQTMVLDQARDRAIA
jgi:chromosome segregation ATPase